MSLQFTFPHRTFFGHPGFTASQNIRFILIFDIFNPDAFVSLPPINPQGLHYKPASKQGHYFWGNFKAHEHRAADNLKWLRETIDDNITFWKMAPVRNTGENKTKAAIFTNLDKDFRAMAWPGNEYVLATNKPRKNIKVNLPPGKWQITRYDVIAKKSECLTERASQAFTFDSPASRAVLFHFKKMPR